MRSYLVLITIFTLASSVPDSFNWANVNDTNYLSSIRNQNFPQVCNSAWAISALNVVNARIKIKRKAAWPDIELSPQVLLECDQSNFGCFGGEPRNAFKWIENNYITDETCNGYVANTDKGCTSASKCMFCNASGCQAIINSKLYTVSNVRNFAGQAMMQEEIYNNGPITCGISVTDELRNYTKGIFGGKGSNIINHFVTVYGWGVEKDVAYWNVANSWGSFWGESGSFRIVRGSNSLGIEAECASAIPVDTWTQDLRNRTQPRMQVRLRKQLEQPIAATIDWRTKFSLTPSRNSHVPTYCNSSYAIALTTLMSDKLRISSLGRTNVVISPQVLLNCGVGSCQTNGNIKDVITFASKYGLPEESCQNYIGVTPDRTTCTSAQVCSTCTGNILKSNCTAVSSRKTWLIPSSGRLLTVQQMKKELATGPIACGIAVTSVFKQYTGGIFSEITILPKINHYVEVVGYGNESGTDYWIARNSWGTTWGESGYFRIQMGKNNLGIETECYWIGTPI